MNAYLPKQPKLSLQILRKLLSEYDLHVLIPLPSKPGPDDVRYKKNAIAAATKSRSLSQSKHSNSIILAKRNESIKQIGISNGRTH